MVQKRGKNWPTLRYIKMNKQSKQTKKITIKFNVKILINC